MLDSLSKTFVKALFLKSRGTSPSFFPVVLQSLLK
ncbi:hypothetical protein PPSIR1_14820 [Plesiocystis pacifica SIR-1]|uniref:Uncharacterized protein n=1 Tax=Plesiocystis pacifica SIR-1 TaxID=391625 RepID=A6GJM0_9BACT|nr:hypothetical protein PPSIR1_14820 [Plesiocystis pacifica SIR-1]